MQGIIKGNGDYEGNKDTGVSFTLENGYTVSIQWGDGNYATRCEDGSARSVEITCFPIKPTPRNTRDEFIFADGEAVKGHVDSSSSLIAWLQKFDQLPDIN